MNLGSRQTKAPLGLFFYVGRVLSGWRYEIR